MMAEDTKTQQQQIIDKLNNKYKDHFYIEEVVHTNEFSLMDYWHDKFVEEIKRNNT